MDKKNKICVVILIICTILVMGLCTYAICTHKRENLDDANKIKKEYEKYNGAVIEGTKNKLVSVEIDENNPFVIKTPKEILDVLKKEKAVVFFGDSKSSLCRNAIEVLIEVSHENNLTKIYYVDIFGISDEYKFAGSIVPKKIKDGTIAYNDIRDFLGDNLKKYYVSDKNGNLYGTGVTRLYAPTLVFVNKGKTVGFHEKTVETHENEFKKLTKDERKELKDYYQNIIDKYKKA